MMIDLGKCRRFSVTVGNILTTIVVEVLTLAVLFLVGWVDSIKTLLVFFSPISVLMGVSLFRAMQTVRCSHPRCEKDFRRYKAVWKVAGILYGYQCPHCGAPFTR